MDETLYAIADRIKNFAVIYLVDITEVPDFNNMYELYDPCTVMFFFRNKHMMLDLGTGNCGGVSCNLCSPYRASPFPRPPPLPPPPPLPCRPRRRHRVTGNNNKINWAIEDKQEMIDIVETVYRGAKKGRGLVIAPRDYSTKYKY